MKQYEIYSCGTYIGSVWADRVDDRASGQGEHRSFYQGDKLVATLWLEVVEVVEKPWSMPKETV